MIIFYVLRIELLVIYKLISIDQTDLPNLATKMLVITLNLLQDSIKTLIFLA